MLVFGDVYLGNNKNLKGTGRRNVGGDISSPNGGRSNGLHVRGKNFDTTFDGYARFNDNEIYLSKNTVRQMWKGSVSAKETLFHEWFHARDYFTGYASYLHMQYPNNYLHMLEVRAHSFNYTRLPNPDRLLRMEHYSRLFWGLSGLF